MTRVPGSPNDGLLSRLLATVRRCAEVVAKDGPRLAGNLLRAARRNPVDAATEGWEAVVQKWERTKPPPSYPLTPEWQAELHRQLGAAWPCPEDAEFESDYDSVLDRLTRAGVRTEAGAFAGWSDGDAAFARAVWCVVRHRRPAAVVETGVARGITTAVVLEALARNGSGRLWSVDLPPQMRPGQNDEIGIAVSPERTGEWTLLRGSSHKLLPPLLAERGSIGLFIHDSRHTAANVLRELKAAWPRLDPGGVAVVDDIDLNSGFARFSPDDEPAAKLVAPSAAPDPARREGHSLFGIMIRRQSPSGGVTSRPGG
jgi:hypothetical protein